MGFKAIPYYCVPTFSYQLFFPSFFSYFFTLKFGAPTHFQRPSAPRYPAQYAHGVNPALSAPSQALMQYLSLARRPAGQSKNSERIHKTFLKSFWQKFL